jgi:hypothetical protein
LARVDEFNSRLTFQRDANYRAISQPEATNATSLKSA